VLSGAPRSQIARSFADILPLFLHNSFVLSANTLPLAALHCGLFHTVNAVVLPLTMQLLNKHNAVDNEGLDSARVNFVMSSMCVVVSQLAMVFVAGRALVSEKGDAKSRFGQHFQSDENHE